MPRFYPQFRWLDCSVCVANIGGITFSPRKTRDNGIKDSLAPTCAGACESLIAFSFGSSLLTLLSLVLVCFREGVGFDRHLPEVVAVGVTDHGHSHNVGGSVGNP